MADAAVFFPCLVEEGEGAIFLGKCDSNEIGLTFMLSVFRLVSRSYDVLLLLTHNGSRLVMKAGWLVEQRKKENYHLQQLQHNI